MPAAIEAQPVTSLSRRALATAAPGMGADSADSTMPTYPAHNHARARSHIPYRPDIDGLRAVAVLAVMAFHLQIRFALGGFTGVDVFFVISGYLISSILLVEMDTGRFSMRAFYVRRIRRIYPALVAAMLGTSVFAFMLCMPSELRDFAKSLIGASLSASNLYFGLHSTYFDPLSLSRPALQTWSLGVEEQFYILFPPLLWLLRKRLPRHLPLVLGLLTAASFTAGVVGSLHTPSLAFFMPWTRACELLLGGLLALGVFPRVGSRPLREMAATVGLLLLLFSFLLLNGAVPFPGFAALAPCGGTALLIWSGQAVERNSTALPTSTWVARVLGTRPFVFVGLISYSLYLWHWPVIVFQGLSTWGDELPHRGMKAILVAISLVLATLSWRFVEVPFRDGSLRLKGWGAFVFAGATSGLLVAGGLTALALHGLPGRFPAAAVAVGRYVDEVANYRVGSCMVIRARDFKPDPCLTESSSKPNWLLIGDSHAAAQWQGLVKAFPAVHILQVSRAACQPDPAQTSGDCGTLMQMIFGHYLLHHHVDRIIAVDRWSAEDVAAIGRLVTWCRSHDIPLTLIGPTQDYDAPLPRLLAYGIMRHDPGLANRHRILETGKVDKMLAQLARTRWHVPYISLIRMFCSSGSCATYANAEKRIPLLLDDNHLSNEGSILSGQRIATEHLLP